VDIDRQTDRYKLVPGGRSRVHEILRNKQDGIKSKIRTRYERRSITRKLSQIKNTVMRTYITHGEHL
jgi:hypothetical protein